MIAGLITKDAAGNVLLDTTTAMFRLLGVLTIRWAWWPNATTSYDWNDKTGSYTNAALALGEPFFFYRPQSFQQKSPLETYLTITASGITASWAWSAYIPNSTPRYVDIAYGVRS